MKDPSFDSIAARRALDAFLVDNQELEQLTARLSAFNLFNVLRIDHVEIRHSNVLAWLLTPSESHGLGPTFLRRFLSRLLMENDGAHVSLSPAQVELMSFNDVEVLREWQNIDILAHSQANGWCLLIENKIHSGEGKGQLLRYLDRVKRDFPGCQIIPVYLTLEGDDPSEAAINAGYLPMSHAQVLELAEQIIDQNRSRIPDDAQVLLDHYLTTLRRLTMQDQELVDLCKAIYRKHRQAIDLIVEYGTTSSIMEAVAREIPRLVDCEFSRPVSIAFRFLPAAVGKCLPSQDVNGWLALPRPVPLICSCRYEKKAAQLRMSLIVGPLADGEKRSRLMKAIQDAGFKFNKAGLKPEAKTTRIVSCVQKLKTNEDGDIDTSDESVQQIVTTLWKKMWKDGEKIIDVAKEFDWS